MRKEAKVSITVVKRLPKYYRYLGMIASKGIIRVSSHELSEITGLTASQIRQDLNHFGGFGQQGYGYNVEELRGEIEKIIGINRNYEAIIVGFGNIGQAIFKYHGFKEAGFRTGAIFDHNPNTIGTMIDDITIRDVATLADYMKEYQPDIGVLAIPAKATQEVADVLCEGGIRGIWNFAPIDLKLPKDIVLENVHLDESLYTLTYYMNNLKDYDGPK